MIESWFRIDIYHDFYHHSMIDHDQDLVWLVVNGDPHDHHQPWLVWINH